VTVSSPESIVVVTGTDTEVGKTYVGARLLERMRLRGLSCAGIKPVESGCDGATDEDGVLLARAAQQDEPLAALQRLRAPLAPPVAAQLEGVELRPEMWRHTVATACAANRIVLVEGAGGLLSPLTWEETTLSFAREWDAPVLVVAANQLGVLNHLHLTLSVLNYAKVSVLGVVFNAPQASDTSTKANVASFQRTAPTVPVVSLARDAARDEVDRVMNTVIGWILNE
jgi:dethiobiotin synthetase